MAPFSPFIASLNFTHAHTLSSGVSQFFADRSMILSYIKEHWESFAAWLSQPYVYYVIIAWVITFTAIITIFLILGFGPTGIAPGSLAAAFQAWAYGAFTPAAGIFATLTSLAMVGSLKPAAAIFAALIATVVAAIVWACGIGT